jgi:hypothetical protein
MIFSEGPETRLTSCHHTFNTCRDSVLIDKKGGQSFNGHLQSDELRAYRTFTAGRIELDNNRTEPAITPTKLGYQNWMFIGREHTGWRSAVIACSSVSMSTEANEKSGNHHA